MDKKTFIKGKPVVTIFHNEENFYSVIRVQIEETNEEINEKEIVMTGSFPLLDENSSYIFFGKQTKHERYGLQYQVTEWKKELPSTIEGLKIYLSSDLFPGVGKKTAEMIVGKFGERTIEKILAQPSLLEEIPRLTEQKAKEFIEALYEHQGLDQVMGLLSQYGIGPNLCMKIYKKFGLEAMEVINHHPYQLIYEVEGIGFLRADEIAKSSGLAVNHPERIQAGCVYCLQEASKQDGHVYLTLEQLVETVHKLLRSQEVTEVDIAREISTLAEEHKVKIEENKVFLPYLFRAEFQFAERVTELINSENDLQQFSSDDILKSLGALEEKLNVEYSPSQVEAIKKALTSHILLLTGGPGTGKTTVINGIVSLYAELHGLSLDINDYKKDESFPIVLVAPTGRAAKRLSEATELPATTIHRLLGYKGEQGFEKDEHDPIHGRLLIIDEVSMVDIQLANQLFSAVPSDMQVILVGDEDQLPSVGPGQVATDLLRSNSIPTATLTDIYRQEKGSSIIQLAHDIKNGSLPQDLSSPKNDRRFFSCNGEQMINAIESVCVGALNKGYTAMDIQVLAPIYRGEAGIDFLNEKLQEIFNPPSEKRREIKFGQKVFRTKDKVLQLVNNPEQHVFNGDIGEIVSIFFAKENKEKEDQIVVSYDGNEVIYKRQDLNQMTHAYCCSIHKSQGSEFPIVVLPVLNGYSRMLQRNLLYTAITRSKEFLIICGQESAFKRAINNVNKGKRQTTLTEKVKQMVGNNHPTS